MNYKARLEQLQGLLKSMPCDALLIENPIDLFYLTGVELSSGKALVGLEKAFLIVDGRYIESGSKQKLYETLLFKEDLLKELIVNAGIHKLGFNKHQTNYQTFLSLNQLADDLKSHPTHPYNLEILPVESIVHQLRMIKDEHEIALLRAAAKLCYQGYEYVVSLLKEGITESELAFELEFFWKKRGASHLSFDSIIAFGPNSSMPHYRAGSAMLQQNMSILIDIGVVLNHYHSDMTRIVFFGTVPSEIEHIYSIVQEAKNKAFERCKPGTLIGELDQIARDWISSKGYGDYFIHSLGHGIGLETHESPLIRANRIHSLMPLQAGMVVTIEPGIYLPEIGGVRLEDTILITESGYEILTNHAIQT